MSQGDYEGDYETAVCVHALVSLNTTKIRHNITGNGSSTQFVDAPSDRGISMKLRHYDLTLKRDQDRKTLEDSFEHRLENICVDIPVDVEFSAQDLMKDTSEASSLQIFQRGEGVSPLLTLSLNLSTISSEGKQDIIWAQAIKEDQPKVALGPNKTAGFNYSYVLRFDKEKIWLILEITVPTTDFWCHQSLMRGVGNWSKLLAESFPNGKPKAENPGVVTSRDFYISGHVPDKTEKVPDSVQHHVLSCELLPYQRRTVRWMMRREGVDLQEGTNLLVPYDKGNSQDLPPTFFTQTDKRGRKCYVSHVLGVVSTDMSALHRAADILRGGILAEEMGLGKTVELIALVSLNKSSEASNDDWSVGATLIITPPSILEQWQKEIQNHAPGVKVFHYKGVKAHNKLATEDLVRIFSESDVVLTTYTVLSAEIHYVQPVERKMRGTKRYVPKKSPLFEVCWWRLCLDEAQMVDGGYSNAAVVAQTIPRVNSWAVTGTPIRKDINDLHGLLKFLRYEPFGDKDKSIFKRLVKLNHVAFKLFFGSITLRHTKDMVRDEVVLPLQKRVVVTVPLSAAEEQNYRHLYEKMCEDCNLDESGVPINGGHDPDPTMLDKMRSWLTRLRMTCLHPQAGEKNRKVFGSKGPLRTAEEVMETMIELITNGIRNDERTRFDSMIQRARFYLSIKNFKTALDVAEATLKEVAKAVQECRDALSAQEILEQEEVSQTEADDSGKNKDGDDNDSDGEDLDVKSSRIGTLKNRLRMFLTLEHSCFFWIATAYFNLKVMVEEAGPTNEDVEEYHLLEVDYYNRAQLARLEINKETRKRALTLMTILREKVSRQEFVEVPDIDPPSTRGGIEGRTHLDNIFELTNALNEQVITLDKWRESLVHLLTKPIMDEGKGEEATGDELMESVVEQELAERYMTAVRALIADREEAFQGLANVLVKHDIQTDLARAGDCQDFFRGLMREKEKLKPKKELRFLRAHIIELRGVLANLKFRAQSGNTRANMEKAFVEAELKKVHETFVVHTKINADLAREVEMLRNVLNARKEYYRQVQEISDTLAEIDVERVLGKVKIDDSLFEKMISSEKALEEKLRSAKTRSRYFEYLKQKGNEVNPECLICRDSYEIGVLTACGHAFCKECMTHWYKTSHKCPSCNLVLNLRDIYQISYKPKEATMQEERNSLGSESSRQSSPAIYADMDDNMLKEIKRIDLKTYYGSKIDMIVKHLLWLYRNEPDFKAVIFSQWSECLEFMKTVLKQTNIGFATLDKKDGIKKFKTDPGCHCFFLHAKSQSAGLSLVNATHVFLCEPLVNISLELQAISRVHRIGQTRPTTVWLYVVNGTVEQSVLEVSTRRRMALMESHAVPQEEGRGAKRSRTPSFDGRGEGGSKRQKMSSFDGERRGEEVEVEVPVSGAVSLKCNQDDNQEGDGGGEGRSKGRSALSPSSLTESISTDRKLDVANSIELQRGLGKLVEKSPGGGEVVVNEDLWDCLFGVRMGGLRGEVVEVVVRRELLAGAAEKRMAEGGIVE